MKNSFNRHILDFVIRICRIKGNKFWDHVTFMQNNLFKIGFMFTGVDIVRNTL